MDYFGSGERLGVQLTYYQLETEELQRRRFVFSREEIAQGLDDIAARCGVEFRDQI